MATEPSNSTLPEREAFWSRLQRTAPLTVSTVFHALVDSARSGDPSAIEDLRGALNVLDADHFAVDQVVLVEGKGRCHDLERGCSLQHDVAKALDRGAGPDHGEIRLPEAELQLAQAMTDRLVRDLDLKQVLQPSSQEPSEAVRWWTWAVAAFGSVRDRRVLETIAHAMGDDTAPAVAPVPAFFRTRTEDGLEVAAGLLGNAIRHNNRVAIDVLFDHLPTHARASSAQCVSLNSRKYVSTTQWLGAAQVAGYYGGIEVGQRILRLEEARRGHDRLRGVDALTMLVAHLEVRGLQHSSPLFASVSPVVADEKFVRWCLDAGARDLMMRYPDPSRWTTPDGKVDTLLREQIEKLLKAAVCQALCHFCEPVMNACGPYLGAQRRQGNPVVDNPFCWITNKFWEWRVSRAAVKAFGDPKIPFERCVRSLQAFGEDIDAESGAAMRLAAKRGSIEVLHILLNCGANPNLKDEQGRTARSYLTRELKPEYDAHVAALRAHAEIARTLDPEQAGLANIRPL